MQINELIRVLRAIGIRYVTERSYVAHAKRLKLITRTEANKMLSRDIQAQKRPIQREYRASTTALIA